MILRHIKIIIILTSFIFLTGFTPILSLLGPGVTIASTGSVYKASAQYLVNQTIEKKTGKNSFDFIKEEIIQKKKIKILQ